jgi:putative transposase
MMVSYPQRKSPRLQGYDYTQEGLYFITICTNQRQMLFGDVVDGEMILNSLGQLAHIELQTLPQHRPNIDIDAFVIMPNHVHAIIVILESLNTTSKSLTSTGSLGAIVGGYKSGVTRKARQQGLVDEGVLWQERYHDAIIRNEQQYRHIALYVEQNPQRWANDTFYS